MVLIFQIALARAGDELQWTPEAQVRPRFEAHTGRDGTSGTGEVLMVSQRARLGGSVSIDEALIARVVVQDVRAWGEEANTLLDYSAGGMDAHLAYLQWKPSEGVALTLGRQEIALHEERLFGAVDWAPQGRSFDAGRLHAAEGRWSADLAYAQLAEKATTLTTGMTDDAWVALLRAGWSDEENGPVDLLVVHDQDHSVDRARTTAGLHATGTSGILSARVEGYDQIGSLGGADISAWMAGGRLTLAPETEMEPAVSLWYDRLSGDEAPTDGTIQAFDTLFQTGHKFYGRLDLFYATGTDGTARGLQDGALKLALKPAEGWSANLDGHLLMPSAPQGGDAIFGEEVDAWLSWKPESKLKLTAGCAACLPSDAARDMDGLAWLEADARF